MTGISRRRFLASLAAVVPLSVVVRRAHAAALRHLESDPATLDALGEAILPSQLGRAGITRAVAVFREWGKYYRENAELVHGYGTSRLRATGPTPPRSRSTGVLSSRRRSRNARTSFAKR